MFDFFALTSLQDLKSSILRHLNYSRILIRYELYLT